VIAFRATRMRFKLPGHAQTGAGRGVPASIVDGVSVIGGRWCDLRGSLKALLWKWMSRDTIRDRLARHDFVLHPASSPPRGGDRRPRSGAEGLQSRAPGARKEEMLCLVSAVDWTRKPHCPRDESGNHPSIRASMGHGFV
jgi:hypothetical protein